MEKKHLYLSVIMPCFWFDHRPATCYSLVAQWTVNHHSALILSFLLGDKGTERMCRNMRFKCLQVFLLQLTET